MKKTIALLAGLALSCSAVGMNAFAAEDTAESGVLKQNVLVTISDGKDLVVPQADVLAKDLDGNDKIDINEALIAAHDQLFEGGAEAGYKASAKEGYEGLSLDKLWGIENGGAYGYYVNSASAWSLSDEVKENDYLDAFVYSDLKSYSDTYSFFDKRESLDNFAGDTLTLTLKKAVWGTDGMTNLPVEGATITIDGKDTGVLTDAEGNATIELTNDTGASIKAVISAVSDKENLVPPVCLADINVKEEETTTETTTEAETTTTSVGTTSIIYDPVPSETSSASATSTAAAANSDSPKTGDAGTGAVAAVLGCTVLAAFTLRRKDV